MLSNMVLLKYSGSIADEINLNGIIIIPESLWIACQTVFNKINGFVEWRPQGSNLEKSFRNYEDMFKYFDVEHISFHEALVLSKLICNKSFCWGNEPLTRFCFETDGFEHHQEIVELQEEYSKFCNTWRSIMKIGYSNSK